MIRKKLPLLLLFTMWSFQLVLSGLVVLIIRNIVFDIPIVDIFNSGDSVIRGDFILVDYFMAVAFGTYATLFLWVRIVLKKNLASSVWLEEVLGEKLLRYLRVEIKP